MVLPFTLNAEKTDSAAESYEYTVSEIDNLLTESDVMAPNDRHDRKACNIVVIEDDPNLRSYLEQRLSKHYNVYTAANGSEGIAKAERICPQIVITDLMMPEADGFDVCRSLRSNIKTSHIPVIMLSGQGKDADNKIKALECGASVFIDKPFDMDYLLGQVANLIKTQNELNSFKLLLGVSGVGPKAALAILSANTPEGLAMAIVTEDAKSLTAAQGIGKKIAQRIILELKDKMAKETASGLDFSGGKGAAVPAAFTSKATEAAAALAVLGYSTQEVQMALKGVDVENLPLEEIIRQSLKKMVK